MIETQTLLAMVDKYERRIARMRTVLRAIRSKCERSAFGGWRHEIAALCDEGLEP